MKKNTRNYLNNKDLLEDYRSWTDRENTQMPNSLAKKIMLLCSQLGKSGRFVGYTWNDEMVADAIYDCVKGAKQFDETRTSNPFAFLTSIAWNAFRKRLNIEHLKLATHDAYKHSMDIIYDVDSENSDDYKFIDNSLSVNNLSNQKDYSAILEKKKKRSTKKVTSLETVFDNA